MKTRSCEIYSKISGAVKCSVRKIAEILGISKSSAHRSIQAIQKRDKHPESHLWELEEGENWLRLLYFGSIIFFVVYGGIGAERLSRFFTLIRINHRVAISPSKIKEIADIASGLLEKYQQEQENRHPVDKPLKIVGGVDETYFSTMILVLMDLSSGYIFLEQESEDKSYETWLELAQKAVSKFSLEFKYVVSDRAKQLIKLATQGFKSSSVPDLFHASHELVKLFGLKLNRMKKDIDVRLPKALISFVFLNELNQNPPQLVLSHFQLIISLEAQQTEIYEGISKYKDILHRISKLLYPFDIENLSPVTSAIIEALLLAIIQEGYDLKEKLNISSKKDHLKKFKNQISEMSSLVDTWWVWVDEYLLELECDESLKDWIIRYLLPYLYWQKQAAKTKSPDLKETYQYAADQVQAGLDENPRSQDYMKNKEMISGLEWMISNFQRTSSAVEGRNGWLSQMNHTARGVSPRRLKAQTVIHNYYLAREDGTTAAERLFHQKFPDPMEWVIERMGELPLPRNRVCELTT